MENLVQLAMGRKIDERAKNNGSETLAAATAKTAGDKFQAPWELKSRTTGLGR